MPNGVGVSAQVTAIRCRAAPKLAQNRPGIGPEFVRLTPGRPTAPSGVEYTSKGGCNRGDRRNRAAAVAPPWSVVAPHEGSRRRLFGAPVVSGPGGVVAVNAPTASTASWAWVGPFRPRPPFCPHRTTPRRYLWWRPRSPCAGSSWSASACRWRYSTRHWRWPKTEAARGAPPDC